MNMLQLLSKSCGFSVDLNFSVSKDKNLPSLRELLKTNDLFDNYDTLCLFNKDINILLAIRFDILFLLLVYILLQLNF